MLERNAENMKLQHLSIIFVIIILPISLVLSSYVDSRVKTLNLQISYDTKLYNSTYDAIKAFQLNTINSGTSNLADSKLRDIEASINSFYNSMQNNFSMNGYNKEALQNHVPALVYTLYDGYYMYSPYENTVNDTGEYVGEGTGEYVSDVKPYVYYSCRYVQGTTDVVIGYTLDSYVTIKGRAGGEFVNLRGYLLSDVKNVTGGNIQYRGVDIEKEQLTERLLLNEARGYENVPYRKVNGVKYYYYDNGNGIADENDFYRIENGSVKNTRVIPMTSGIQETGATDYYERAKDFIVNNASAQEYYQDAIELKNNIIRLGLDNLKVGNAVDERGNPIDWNVANTDIKIFEELKNTGSDSKSRIEDETSQFNSHRMDVIKYTIEKNLSVAIANFNKVSTATSEFGMPKLRDYEWDKLTQNIGMISFLQGLNIGGKLYNGYTVVTNNKNEEYVAEESIYMETTSDNTFHRAQDADLENYNESDILGGYFNIDYERKTIDIVTQEADGTEIVKSQYYYPREATGCYHSIIAQEDVQDFKLKDWLTTGNAKQKNIAKRYYTALARERQGLYRVEEAF